MTRNRSQANAHKRSPAPAMEPPIALDKAALAVWEQTLSSCAADHFARADLRMLATFCRACAVLDGLHERIAADPGADLQLLRSWKDTLATVTSLAAKLRLTPSSRTARRNSFVDPTGTAGAGWYGGG